MSPQFPARLTTEDFDHGRPHSRLERVRIPNDVGRETPRRTDLLGLFEPFIPGGRLGWGRGDIAV